jgi:hypothetical protein
VPTVVEASEGDGWQVATLAGIAARQVQGLVADGRSEDDNPRGGARRATGAVNALDCGDGRGIAGATTTPMMGGPGNNDVESVGSRGRGGDDNDDVDPRGDDDDDTTISLAMATATRVVGDKEGDGGKSNGEGKRRRQ